jgi:hypothetical protein
MDFGKAKHLILPSLNGLRIPRTTYFPNAIELTVYKWEPLELFKHLEYTHFPNVKRINYLSGPPCSNSMFLRFFDVKFHILGFQKDYMLVPQNRVKHIHIMEYLMLKQLGSDPLLQKLWHDFILKEQVTKMD